MIRNETKLKCLRPRQPGVGLVGHKPYSFFAFLLALSLAVTCGRVSAVDSESSRVTLNHLAGVHVIVEDLQPNLQKYVKRQELSKEEIQKQVEAQLRASGIRVLSREEWLQTQGRPIFYININTHEHQKYQFAYDVKTEVQQVAFLETNPPVRALVTTWSVNMTGSVNIGATGVIYDSVRTLTGIFVKAYLASRQR